MTSNSFVVAAVDVAGVCFPGGLFSKTEMSEVLTEIVKADPTFDKDSFLKQCEKDIIPNILEVNRLPQLVLLSLFVLHTLVFALYQRVID